MTLTPTEVLACLRGGGSAEQRTWVASHLSGYVALLMANTAEWAETAFPVITRRRDWEAFADALASQDMSRSPTRPADSAREAVPKVPIARELQDFLIVRTGETTDDVREHVQSNCRDPESALSRALSSVWTETPDNDGDAHSPEDRSSESGGPRLTDIEKRGVFLLLKGHSAEDVIRMMGLSSRAARYFLGRLCRKLAPGSYLRSETVEQILARIR
ncbi:hypothetical protein B7486_02025 [cyanobacterium TDX16]|nr:hypothetical protein B7486_02025 [cyanobacterium TDX16]